MRQLLVVTALLFLAAMPLGAADAWVILGSAQGATNGCASVIHWSADALVQNVGTAPATVRVIHDSNGGIIPTPAALEIAPDRSVAMSRLAGSSTPNLFIRHLDVPAEVLIDGRLEYRYDFPCSTIPPPLGAAGKAALPVFHKLTPANERQIILGTDLGIQNARINVGVYNAGSDTAVATLVARRGPCDGVTQIVSIPPDTLVQVTLKVPPTCDPPPDTLGLPWAAFTSVTVDQPSLTYASVLSNNEPPQTTFTIATGAQ